MSPRGPLVSAPRRAHACAPAVLVAALTLVLAHGAVARAESCPNAGPRAEQGIAEGATHSLPDCRAYELSSPPLKNEQEVNVPDRFVAEASFQAAEEGGGVVYSLTGAIPGSESGGLYGHVVSRSPAPGSSWSATPLEPSDRLGGLHGAGENSGEFESFSPSLGCGAIRTRLAAPAFPGDEQPQLPAGPEGEPLESPEEQIDNLYLWRGPDEYTLISNVRPPNPDKSPEGPTYHVDGISDDCSTVLFEDDNAGYQLPVGPGGEPAPQTSLYEWKVGSSPEACRANQETCRPVVASVLPDGALAEQVIDAHAGEFFSDLHELSRDGRRAYFTAISDGKGPGEEKDAHARQIYLRESGHTTAVSISPNKEIRDTGAKFEAASADGGRVFFVANYGLAAPDGTSTCLLEDINKSKDENNGAGTGCDLYEYNVTSGTLSDLSADTSDAHGADVRGVLGASEDGSVVYFSCTGQLVPGEGNSAEENERTEGTTRSGEAKTEAEANVYAYSAGVLHYVTTIGEAEAGGWNLGGNPLVEVDAISANKGMHYYNARVSPSGAYLLLATRHRVGAYDNTQQETGRLEWEEYEYSLQSGTVSCASCNPTGEQPIADQNDQFSPLGPFDVVQNGVVKRNLTDDGRVFFDSLQPLRTTAGGTSFTATNHSVNVYEWTPAGLEGCEPTEVPEGESGAGGCLALLSTGTDPFPTYFEGASADAHDAYITTHAALVPQDQDGLNDIYDVRVGGGLPPTPQSPSCSAEMQGCQPPGQGLGSSQHASESGAGGGNLTSNVTPPPPGKGVGAAQAVKAYVKGKVKGTTATISVVAPAKGRILAAGAGLTSARMSAAKAGTYRLKVSLTAKKRKLLHRKHKLKLKLRVSFSPAQGRGSATTALLTFV
ncbi:MAG TPA: hypothetical protein VMI13_05945 [Solirubrobacteraceae bacterium]|nr:hypothetical protein [Solirubrobacteraceae bacterium]